MMSCHECHPGVWLDEKKAGSIGSTVMSQYTASQFNPVFSQKFGPGPLRHRKKLLMSLVPCQT